MRSRSIITHLCKIGRPVHLGTSTDRFGVKIRTVVGEVASVKRPCQTMNINYRNEPLAVLNDCWMRFWAADLSERGSYTGWRRTGWVIQSRQRDASTPPEYIRPYTRPVETFKFSVCFVIFTERGHGRLKNLRLFIDSILFESNSYK